MIMIIDKCIKVIKWNVAHMMSAVTCYCVDNYVAASCKMGWPKMIHTGLWRWCINITITILDFICRPVFYLKHNVSEAEFCLRFQVEPTQLGPTDRPTPCLRNQLLFVELCWFVKPYWCCCWCPQTQTSSIYSAQLSRFHLKTGTKSSLQRCVLNT
jgi:hypothetical protein